jgi:hypothetical protein
MTTKTVAYTQEQIAEMTATYTANPTRETAEAIATQFGKTANSVVAKLAQLGIYKKAEKATAKTGETKLQLAQRLAPNDETMQNDLVKLTKVTLAKLVAFAEATGEQG